MCEAERDAIASRCYSRRKLSRFRNRRVFLTEGNVVMYFDERRFFSKLEPGTEQGPDRVNPAIQQSTQSPERSTRDVYPPSNTMPPQEADAQAAHTQDKTNNKLQELMQLLYLLSRDPGVPKDARYHVTVAQGEIALLANVLRNTASSEAGDAPAPVAGHGSCAAHP
jgi:hypothetical protein